MRRILLVNANGLGDHVMATPALRKYKEANPDSYVVVAGLERFGKTLKQLLSGLPFIDEVATILPDPWRDGVENYQKNLEEVLKVADEYGKTNQFNQGIFLPTNRQEGYRLHKIFRFESELGVSFSCLSDLQTELNVCDEYIKKADEFLSKYKRPIALFHNEAGNPPKEFNSQEVKDMMSNFTEYTILEFGKDIGYDDMEFTKAVIKQADLIVAIDSVVMHIAGAFNKDLVVLFKSTPAHQAVPLTYNVNCLGYDNEQTQLRFLPQYRYNVAEIYGFPEFKVGNPIIREGLGNVGSENRFDYEKYKKIQLKAEERDGEPRLTLEDHGEEAIKFFKEVEKYFPSVNDLPSEKGKQRVLDMGCATAYHTSLLAEKYGKAVGIDINEDLVEAAKKNHKDVRVMDIHDMTFRNKSFDFILAKDILEHSYAPDKIIKKMYDLLKDGGQVLVFMPLDGSVRNVETVDLGLRDGYIPHVWKSTYDGCIKKFEDVGFNVEAHKLNISDVTGRVRQFGDEAIILIGRK